MKKEFAALLFIAIAILFSGCPQPPEACGNGIIESGENCSTCPADVKCSSTTMCENGMCMPLPSCIGEGKSVPVIANPPECCEGLELIPPKEENMVGASGICTAFCGNGVCELETESPYNCSKDCIVKNCNDYNPPMTPGDIANCTCPQEMEKFYGMVFAYCATNSEMPCNSHAECPSGENCISYNGTVWVCSGMYTGCYYPNPEEPETEICVD
ncbi:MAG: hypothetical protein JW772_03310 [Candidatus Diapherotrites archaeon]|nr:hypothetical protein [Candidatus Diapherotrites archaeon]